MGRGDFYKSPFLFTAPIMKEVIKVSVVIKIIEKIVTGFICIGLFSLIGDKVAGIVHLSTLTIEKQYFEIKNALSKKEEN